MIQTSDDNINWMEHLAASIILSNEVQFQKFCQTLNLTVCEQKMALKFKNRSFGRAILKLDDFILRECGYNLPTYEQNKMYALIELRASNVPFMFYNDTKYYNKQILLTFDNFVKFTHLPGVKRQMTNISRLQLIKFMKICLGFHDASYFNFHYNPFDINESFSNIRNKDFMDTKVASTATLPASSASSSPPPTAITVGIKSAPQLATTTYISKPRKGKLQLFRCFINLSTKSKS